MINRDNVPSDQQGADIHFKSALEVAQEFLQWTQMYSHKVDIVTLLEQRIAEYKEELDR